MYRQIQEETRAVLKLSVDGEPVTALEGEMVAGVLARLNPFWARTNAVSGQARAPYCMMGVCFDCLVSIDGVSSQQACMVRVREGMSIARQHGARNIGKSEESGS